MSRPTDFKQEMEAEDRKAWLESEYIRLKQDALPLVKMRDNHLASLKAVEEQAEAIARKAFGVLLALGTSESEAAKEIASWRKPAESK